MRDNTCTYCGVAGHRAHRCPRRASLTDGLVLLALLAIVFVANLFKLEMHDA